MRNLILFFLLFGSVAVLAQKGAKPETYAKTITAADLKKRLAIVAGPEMEGRETATEGQRRAAAYIESQFKQIGLQPGANGQYQQTYPVYQDSLLGATLEVAGQAFAQGRDFTVLLSSSINATMAFSEVVYLPAAFTSDSLSKINLAGKLVLLPPESTRSSYSLLQNKGIAAVLWVRPAAMRAAFASSSGQMLNRFRKSMPLQVVFIAPEVATAILKTSLDSAKQNSQIKTYKADVLLDVKKETGAQLHSSNVVGVVEGTDLKDQYLFVTGHYDHLGKRGDSVIYYGADDDGSGTVSVLELAEAFAAAKKAGKGPRRTVVFMTVSGEEKGLWGSEYYSGHPLFPLDRTTADLNIDMIGRSDSSRRDTTNYVYVVGDDKLSSDLRPISEAVNAKDTKLQLDYKFNDPNDKEQIYYRSDHYNFAKMGVPIIFYYDGMLGADYHKPTDTPDKINYDLLAKRAQLVFYTAWEMANRTEQLKRDKPLPVLAR